MDEFLVKVEKTLGYHWQSLLRATRGLYWDAIRTPAERPVFIVGCSRAGTTLVYKTFSESAELGSLQRETHDFWAELHPLSESGWSSHELNSEDASTSDRDIVTRYFFSATGKRRFVDKNNQNGLCVSYLQALFPDACFVYVKRSPGDNINSLMEGWRRPEEFATWSGDLPAEIAIDNGDITRWSFFLPAGWRDYANATLEDVCAFQYFSMNDALLNVRDQIAPGQWTEVCYEDLLDDPGSIFQEAFERCGLEFTEIIEAHCNSVLTRPYNAFSEIRKDKWRDSRNRERIERVIPKVQDIAIRMGYRG